MKIYHVEEISTLLWTFAAIFFMISLVLFFALHIRKAFKIVMGTNFKISGTKTKKELKSQSKELIRNSESNKLYSSKFASGGGAKPVADSGETVLLGFEEQSESGGRYEATSILTNFDFMNETTNDEKGTMVLERNEFELVVDLMFIHTEQRV